jgi:hypothetical protein
MISAIFQMSWDITCVGKGQYVREKKFFFFSGKDVEAS